MAKQIEISVREFVEFIMRSGHIDHRFGGYDRALIGAAIHRQIQKKSGGDYTPEVTLCDTTEYQGFTFVVRGRADGIIRNDTGVTIDEIKTTGQPLDAFDEGQPQVHWAQAMCYAWFVLKEEALDGIAVRLTYCQADTREIRMFTRTFDGEALRSFYEGLLAEYIRWAQMETQWIACRDASIEKTGFPYPNYRKGQREMAVAVYRTITMGKRLFCQAPTGIGKTLSVLFPSIKALGEGTGKKIFYLTAKTVTQSVAEEAIDQLRAAGLHIKSLSMTAKDKICFLEERRCNPEDCPYAKDYFDRVNDVVFRMLASEEAFTREVIEDWARTEKLCPFELSLDLAPWVDIVIGDYNYLFDPVVSLRRFYASIMADSIFLVDESHNLVERSRRMYSASLRKSDFLALKRSLTPADKPLYKALDAANKAFIALRKQCEESGMTVWEESRGDLNEALAVFNFKVEAFTKKHPEHEALDAVMALYFEVWKYLIIADLYDEGYVTTIALYKSEVAVTQQCLDPADKLSEIIGQGLATVFFSATLTPMDYYIRILGGSTDALRLSIASPFPQEGLKILMADGISTRYTDRAESYEPLAEMIAAFTGGQDGNYLVFFPSYAYMEAVLEPFRQVADESEEILVQRPEMDDGERRQFLEAFDHEPAVRRIGFCVMGGIFGEGIDLKGDRLIGAVIVGVGLPQICRERDLLRGYYDDRGGCGFDYAYRNPGMNKVIQAMGRVIRGEEDRGMILLIDDRYGRRDYARLLPPHLRRLTPVASAEEVRAETNRFWQKKDQPDQ
jgi:DNA excision repair protein ERCC-2